MNTKEGEVDFVIIEIMLDLSSMRLSSQVRDGSNGGRLRLFLSFEWSLDFVFHSFHSDYLVFNRYVFGTNKPINLTKYYFETTSLYSMYYRRNHYMNSIDQEGTNEQFYQLWMMLSRI